MTETFRLTVISSTLERFGNSKLGDGVQFTSYADQVVVLNGKAPYTFTISSVTLNGTAKPNGLGDLGLGISTDGLVYGVPIAPGAVSFVCKATDANGKTAVGRNGTGSSQTYTFTIAAGIELQGSLVATQITVKAGNPLKKNVPQDSVSFKGSINLGSIAISSLSGKPLGLSVGSASLPTGAVLFDAKGSAKTPKGSVPSASFKLSTKGLFNGSVKNASIPATGLSGLASINLPVQVTIGDALCYCYSVPELHDQAGP